LFLNELDIAYRSYISVFPRRDFSAHDHLHLKTTQNTDWKTIWITPLAER